VIGKLEQKVTYIPNSVQSFAIPAIKLFWWNLQTNTNDVAQLHSLTVQVKGSASKEQTPAAPAATTVTPAKPVVASEPKIKTDPFYHSIWFWVASFLFTIWLITMWLLLGKRKPKEIIPVVIETPVTNTKELSQANFAQACSQGDAITAQQFLLSWAKKHWQETAPNLEKLRELVDDENFKKALQDLEQTIYAKKHSPWNGTNLLSAYQEMNNRQKRHFFKNKTGQNKIPDPLPPLNP
jgi:hypothetical protein